MSDIRKRISAEEPLYRERYFFHFWKIRNIELRLIVENLQRIFSNIFQTELHRHSYIYIRQFKPIFTVIVIDILWTVIRDIFRTSRIFSKINFIKNHFYIYIHQFNWNNKTFRYSYTYSE